MIVWANNYPHWVSDPEWGIIKLLMSMRTCVLPCDRPKPYLRDALMYSFEVLQPDNLHIWHDTRLFGIGRNKKLQFYGLFLNFWTKFFGTNFSMAHCVQSHISKMPYWILLEFYSMITCIFGIKLVFLELKKNKYFFLIQQLLG